MMQRAMPWLLPTFLILLWQCSAAFGWLPSRVLPTPWTVLQCAIQLAQSGELASHVQVSFRRALVGFAIGGGLGFTLGILTGASTIAESLIDGTVQMLRTVPHLALIPLVILWFGVGETAKIFLVALGVMFPIYLNTYHGVRSVDPGLVEMGRVYGLSRWGVFRSILFPGALPSILVGVRYSLGVMWLTLIVAETIAATSGIGYLAMHAREFLRTDVVVLSILLYAILGKIADWIARWLEYKLMPWRPKDFRTKNRAATEPTL